jgi:hypothetical protein
VGVVAPKYAKLKSYHPRVHVKDTPSINKKNPHGLGGGSNEDVLINNSYGPNEGVKSRSEESIHIKQKTE